MHCFIYFSIDRSLNTSQGQAGIAKTTARAMQRMRPKEDFHRSCPSVPDEPHSEYVCAHVLKMTYNHAFLNLNATRA